MKNHKLLRRFLTFSVPKKSFSLAYCTKIVYGWEKSLNDKIIFFPLSDFILKRLQIFFRISIASLVAFLARLLSLSFPASMALNRQRLAVLEQEKTFKFFSSFFFTLYHHVQSPNVFMKISNTETFSIKRNAFLVFLSFVLVSSCKLRELRAGKRKVSIANFFHSYLRRE